MIVCVCNRLNDTKIRSALSAGAQTVDDVYAHCGVQRICGTCQETIEELLPATPDVRLEAAE